MPRLPAMGSDAGCPSMFLPRTTPSPETAPQRSPGPLPGLRCVQLSGHCPSRSRRTSCRPTPISGFHGSVRRPTGLRIRRLGGQRLMKSGHPQCATQRTGRRIEHACIDWSPVSQAHSKRPGGWSRHLTPSQGQDDRARTEMSGSSSGNRGRRKEGGAGTGRWDTIQRSAARHWISGTFGPIFGVDVFTLEHI